jgi:plasmid stability protein
MNITVKNVPDPIYRVIKREAKRHRRSLNSEIIQALEKQAAEAERLRQLSTLRDELDRFAASFSPLDDSTPLIREDREQDGVAEGAAVEDPTRPTFPPPAAR